jgi:hypothetical protein
MDIPSVILIQHNSAYLLTVELSIDEIQEYLLMNPYL